MIKGKLLHKRIMAIIVKEEKSEQDYNDYIKELYSLLLCCILILFNSKYS